MRTYWVYILKCSDGSYYTGSTSNIEKRISEFQQGEVKGYTQNRRPIELVFSEYFDDVYNAISAERKVKKWTRVKKEALIDDDFKLLHKLSECRNDSNSKNYEK